MKILFGLFIVAAVPAMAVAGEMGTGSGEPDSIQPIETSSTETWFDQLVDWFDL